MTMAPIFPAISALAAALLPASKTLAGFAATAAHSSGGLLHALQDKLRAWEDKEFALKEKVRSRLHVVFVLRPFTPQEAVSPVERKPSLLKRVLYGSGGSKDCPDTAVSSWTGKYLLSNCDIDSCDVGSQEKRESTVQSIDLGDGALRHEMVLVKQGGFICVDYKGVMYRILSREGSVMPAGLTAFRINVAYDMLRSAVQSGEFVVEADQRQLELLSTPSPPSFGTTPVTPGSVFAEDAALVESPRLSDQGVLRGGLSEAMGPWLKVRLRAEMHVMRGPDVLYASYIDTEFSKDNMVAGTRLHTLGQDDGKNPYCLFVSQQEAAILAQCNILSVVDLHAESATAGSSPAGAGNEEGAGQGAAPGTGSLKECVQSYSRIRDIKGDIQMANIMPWISSLTQAVTATTAPPKK